MIKANNLMTSLDDWQNAPTLADRYGEFNTIFLQNKENPPVTTALIKTIKLLTASKADEIGRSIALSYRVFPDQTGTTKDVNSVMTPLGGTLAVSVGAMSLLGNYKIGENAIANKNVSLTVQLLCSEGLSSQTTTPTSSRTSSSYTYYFDDVYYFKESDFRNNVSSTFMTLLFGFAIEINGETSHLSGQLLLSVGLPPSYIAHKVILHDQDGNQVGWLSIDTRRLTTDLLQLEQSQKSDVAGRAVSFANMIGAA